METYLIICLTAAICACIFGILGLLLGITALIKVTGLEKSTHTVQWVPADKDSWAMDDKDVEKLNAEIKEEAEELIL